jgi:transposase
MASRLEVRRVAGGRYWREAEARVVVAAWQESGKTLSAFAQQHGVDPRRLARWSSQLRRAAPAAVRFHPVRLAGGSAGSRDAGTIEIELGGGRRVRVGPGFDVEDLRRVVAVLEGARC